MIINGGSRGKWKRFAVHLGNEKDNERVRLAEVRGMSATTIRQGFVQLQAMADMAGAGNKEFYYHANINPKDDETLSPEQRERAGEQLRDRLGLEGQPGMTIEHTKAGRTHRHYVILRVDLDSGKLISDGWNYLRYERTARELEREFALSRVEGALVEREGPRPERRPKNWEVQRGERTGIDPKDVKAEVTRLWREADSGTAFRAALAKHGYVLAQAERRDFCIVDPSGSEHSLARRIEGVKAVEIRGRMADVDRDVLPQVSGGRKKRRQDQKKVEVAVGAGADKKRIASAINASRASEILPQEGDEKPRDARARDAYDSAVHHQKRTAAMKWRQMESARQTTTGKELEHER